MVVMIKSNGTVEVDFHELFRRVYKSSEINPRTDVFSMIDLSYMIAELQRLAWSIDDVNEKYTFQMQKDYDELEEEIDQQYWYLMEEEWDQVRTYQEGFWNVINRALGVDEEE